MTETDPNITTEPTMKAVYEKLSISRNDRWEARYREYINFILENHRCPSKYRKYEMRMHSWYKHNRKLLNTDKLKADRRERFKSLIALAEANRHVNQFA